MATIVTRETTQTDGTSPKGSPLTNAEVDTNFINLNDDKVEVSGAIIFEAQAGEALAKGDVVYVSGVSGNTPVVSKADADDANKMPAYGLAEDAANLNAAVNVVTFGTLYELDTSGFSAGDIVYVSTTAGSLTATKPTGESSLVQNVGTVIRSHASAGSIKVGGAGRTNDTPNLNDGNVFIGNASNQAVARALTGDDISGGTITSFASTGIDDNASQTSMVLSNGSMRILSDDFANHIASISGYDDTNTTQLGKLQFGASTGQNSGIYSTTAFSISNAPGDASYTFTVDTANNEVEINGDLGIGGIANPQAPLHVYKTEASVGETDPIARFERFTTGDNAYLDITVDNDNNLIGFQSTGTSDGGFTFGGAATERMRLTSAGLLGILTNDPARELDIKLAQSTITTLGQKGGINLYSPSNTVGNGGEITWSSAINGEVWAAISGHIISNGSGTAGGELVFATATNAALPTERMRLDNAGNFGIGVTDPTATLDVNGTFRLNGNSTSTGHNLFIGDAVGEDLTTGLRNTAIGSVALRQLTTADECTAFGYAALNATTTGQNNTAVGRSAIQANTTGRDNTAVGYVALTKNTTGDYNVALGSSALNENTTGTYNVAIGYQALEENTTGTVMVGIGFRALEANTTGHSNTAVGYEALKLNTTGLYNTAFGRESLEDNTSGNYNSAFGTYSLYDNTTGQSNVGVGYGAVQSNTTANYNTGVGYQALLTNTTGANNVAVGSFAAKSNTGSSNTAIGYATLWASGAGSNNTAVGLNALFSNTSGDWNTAVGTSSLVDNTTGIYQTAVGGYALENNTTGVRNTSVGYASLRTNTTGGYNTGLGYAALNGNTSGFYNVAIGYNAALGLTTDSYNVAIGFEALKTFTSQGSSGNVAVGGNSQKFATSYYNVSVGYQSLQSATTHSNTAIGHRALLSATSGNGQNTAVGAFSLDALTTGAYNTAVGDNALTESTTGSYSAAVGKSALAQMTTGHSNNAFGYSSLYSLTTGLYNTGVGFQSLYSVTTGTHNVAIGYATLQNNTASDNTAVGNYALYSNTSGTYSAAIGYAAGYYSTATGTNAFGYNALLNTTTGSQNLAMGVNALVNNTTGARNVGIGSYTLGGKTTGDNNTAVGYAAGNSCTTGNNNTFVGAYNGSTGGAGYYMTTGNKNTILGSYNGNQGGLDIRTSNNYIVLSDGDGSPRQIINGSGYLFYYTMASGAGNSTLKYNTSTGAVTYDTSSERFKDNIRDSAYGLADVMQMRSRMFEYKDNGRTDVGLIAEELNPIIPELVGKDADDIPESVSYDRIVSVLVKAVQELSAKVEALEAQLSGE